MDSTHECATAGAQAVPQSWRLPLREDRSCEARTPGLRQLLPTAYIVSRSLDWRSLLGSCCTPPHSTSQPVRWVEGPRAQIPQCLGQDYPTDPTCHHICGQQGPLWIACPVPSSRDYWLQPEQLSLVSTPQSPWLRSLGVFIYGAQEAPAIWKLPKEHSSYSPGQAQSL